MNFDHICDTCGGEIGNDLEFFACRCDRKRQRRPLDADDMMEEPTDDKGPRDDGRPSAAADPDDGRKEEGTKMKTKSSVSQPGPKYQRVLTLMEQRGDEGIGQKDIMEITGWARNSTYTAIHDLKKAGYAIASLGPHGARRYVLGTGERQKAKDPEAGPVAARPRHRARGQSDIEIYEYLLAHPEGATTHQIAAALTMNLRQVQGVLGRLEARDKTRSEGKRNRIWKIKEPEQAPMEQAAFARALAPAPAQSTRVTFASSPQTPDPCPVTLDPAVSVVVTITNARIADITRIRRMLEALETA